MSEMEDIVAMARAAEKDERLSDGALYGKLAAEIEQLKRDLATYSKDTEDTENRIIDAEFKAQEAETALAYLREAALPFAAHDWMDAELEDDSCKLTKHSGPVTVGHWRALRLALAAKDTTP